MLNQVSFPFVGYNFQQTFARNRTIFFAFLLGIIYTSATYEYKPLRVANINGCDSTVTWLQAATFGWKLVSQSSQKPHDCFFPANK